MTATSPYLDLPCRSEAEATLEKCKLIRQAAENFQTNIRNRIREVGGDPQWIDLTDGLGDALGDVEAKAHEVIYEAECRDEAEHERVENGMAMFRSGVEFGRV